MADENTAISGSRDTTLRIWDIRTGMCRNVLVGHQSSVRCLEIKGDIVVSGSYDTFARVWSISEGRCLQTLQGHFSQIYAIAFDGKRVVTGSLDTNVRIWDPKSGYVPHHPRPFGLTNHFIVNAWLFCKAIHLSWASFRCGEILSLLEVPMDQSGSGPWKGCAPYTDLLLMITV